MPINRVYLQKKRQFVVLHWNLPIHSLVNHQNALQVWFKLLYQRVCLYPFESRSAMKSSVWRNQNWRTQPLNCLLKLHWSFLPIQSYRYWHYLSNIPLFKQSIASNLYHVIDYMTQIGHVLGRMTFFMIYFLNGIKLLALPTSSPPME